MAATKEGDEAGGTEVSPLSGRSLPRRRIQLSRHRQRPSSGHRSSARNIKDSVTLAPTGLGCGISKEFAKKAVCRNFWTSGEES